jgi:hypothetical protein
VKTWRERFFHKTVLVSRSRLNAEKTDISNTMDNAKRKPRSASAEVKHAELKRRLLEISDLRVAGALRSRDQATYMPMRELLVGPRPLAFSAICKPLSVAY